MVPTANGYRSAATKDVDGLRDAAQIFHAETIDYAREMIADTQKHDAKTVGELLAFMRKYRLLFATAERTLGGSEMYGRLYGLMREQKEKLGIKDKPKPEMATATPEPPPAAPSRVNSFAEILSGNWDIDGDELVQTSRSKSAIHFGDPGWSNYDFTFKVNSVSQGDGFTAETHFKDNRNFVFHEFGGNSNTRYNIGEVIEGRRIFPNWKNDNIVHDRWYEVKIQVRGKRTNAFLNGQKVFGEPSINVLHEKGQVGFSAWNSTMRIRDIKVVDPNGRLLWSGLPMLP